MSSFLHLDPQPIVAHAEQHGLNLFEVRLEEASVGRVEPSRIFSAMSESYNLLGASPDYMIVVTASNALDLTRCREDSLSEGEFMLVPYNDGGVISCSTMDLPFQSEQNATRADWWKLPARLKHLLAKHHLG
jgi:hypothetical protein